VLPSKTIDLAVAEKYIATITRGGDACFQTFNDMKDSKGNTVIPQWKYGKFSQLSKWLIDENMKGAGIYIVVNEGDGKGRSKENITKVRAVFVDLDGAPIENLRRANPIPNIVIESSPGRFHGYWLVDDCPLDRFTEIQSALAKKFNGDPSVKDLPRVMRIPGFLHKKGEAYASQMKYCNPSAIHETERLIESLGLGAYKEKEPTPAEQPTNGESLCIPKGQRHGAMSKTVGRLRNSGLSGTALLNAAMAWNSQHCSPPLAFGEVEKLVKWGNSQGSYSNNWFGPAPDPKRYFDISRTFEQLAEVAMDPVRWVIEGVLPEGLCILAGKPKVGKSWLTQSWCLSVANGTPAMGCFKTAQGKVLSVSLEDSARRFKSRMMMLLDGEKAPGNAFFVNEWPSMPHAATMLRKWLDENGDTSLIILDTLGKIQGKRQSKGNAYYSEYEDIGSLQTICHEYRVAMVVVHHLRKGEADDDIEAVSGTIGLTGAADTIALLRRPDREKTAGKLIIHGRDISDKYYDIEFQKENGLWLYKGDASDDLSEGSMDVIDLMQDGVPRSKGEIVKKLYGEAADWKTRRKLENIVLSLKERGILCTSALGRGKYVLVSDVAGAACADE
jgi:hypothetical protein